MSEERELKRAGAKAQKNSGRGTHAKGDGVLDPFLVDVKEYDKSFGVSTKVWAKLSLDAYKAGNLEPALYLVLGEEGKWTRLWVVSDAMFHQMHEAWMEKYGDVQE